MTRPVVSVVMPVRNGERWLVQACRSVLAQTSADLELIVIDDGSDDGTPAILDALAGCDLRVRRLRQPGLGMVAALNRGIAMAEAPLVARLDADDIATPARLARQAAYLDANPAVVLLGSWADRIDSDGRPAGQIRPDTDSDRLAALLLRRNPFVHSSVMLRTEVLRATGGYRAVCEAAEDYDLWLRLSERGRIAIQDEALVLYRRHDQGVTERKTVRQSFSSRLARRAALSRRASGHDPLSDLNDPPDWWAEDATLQFYAADARLARFLDLAEADAIDPRRVALAEIPRIETVLSLSHVEKKLARRAVRNLMSISHRPEHLSAPRLVGFWVELELRRLGRRGEEDPGGGR